MDDVNTVSIIIATTCESKRRVSLLKAIDSVLSQEGLAARVLAVVNGNRVDIRCLAQLRAISGVTVVEQEQGSLPLALQTGRSHVNTPFFGFLDDDDEYLPGGLAQRLAPLLADPGLDFVASNGLRRIDGVDYPVVKRIDAIRQSPLLALGSENWLASCGGLYRSESVGVNYFDGKTAYLEWTFLAYRLASTLTMSFVDRPTFVINDSAESLSKSDAYFDAEAHVLPQILSLQLPAAVHRAVHEKMGRSLHNIAERKRTQGKLAEAWRAHGQSLRCPGGWRYLLYGRKLFKLGAKRG